ncbi:MAG: HigA family addiction module antitoxin [Acidobacteriota bacterium]
MPTGKPDPLHPGEILFEEFLEPLGLSQNALARGLGVPPRLINEIVHGARRVTADTALRLGRFFGTSPEFWLGLQMDYELDTESDRLKGRLEKEVREYRRTG